MSDAAATLTSSPRVEPHHPELDSVDLHEDAHAFVVTHPLRLDQLEHELMGRTRWHKRPGITVDGDESVASPDQPITVYVHRLDLDPDAFVEVVGEHRPDPAWQDPREPSVEHLMAQVQTGQQVGGRDLQRVLQQLLKERAKA